MTAITLAATGVKTTLTLSWQSASGVGWQPVPEQYLFTQSQIDRLRDTYVRFLKAASLASALSLDANEIAYLAYDPSRAVATSAKDKTVAGPVTLHPASMANIVVGSRLQIDAGAAQEVVEVTAVAATSFNAVTTQAHDGSVSAIPDRLRAVAGCRAGLAEPVAGLALCRRPGQRLPGRGGRRTGCAAPCRQCSTSRG